MDFAEASAHQTLCKLSKLPGQVLWAVEGRLVSLLWTSQERLIGVSHVGLLHKVHSLGIDGPLQRWLASYLDTRSLQCLVGGRTSATYTTSSGVPQGSILGPTLFLAYVNDAPDVLADGASLEAYADDTTLYSLVTSQQTPDSRSAVTAGVR